MLGDVSLLKHQFSACGPNVQYYSFSKSMLAMALLQSVSVRF